MKYQNMLGVPPFSRTEYSSSVSPRRGTVQHKKINSKPLNADLMYLTAPTNRVAPKEVTSKVESTKPSLEMAYLKQIPMPIEKPYLS